jgi:hypothetical protein
MGRTRPTLRVLREDLKLALPPLPDPLDEISHPLLAKADEQFADDGTPHERIRAIDDKVLFKLKTGRWRGAAWLETGSEVPVWLVAAGLREDGSKDDFYAALTTAAQAARARYNTAHTPPLPTMTHSRPWLPTADDWDRYALEAGARFEQRLTSAVRELVTSTLQDGREHAALLDGLALGIQILTHSEHETYVAIRIIGSVPENLTALILSSVPACDPTGWAIDDTMPDRPIAAAEQIWSNLMDPAEASKLLHDNNDT